MEKAETKNVFKDFCESTSLHGYSYLFIGNSIFLKIIWTIVILLMTCVGAWFLMNNTVDYLNATLVTTIESSSAPLKVKSKTFLCSQLLMSYSLWIISLQWNLDLRKIFGVTKIFLISNTRKRPLKKHNFAIIQIPYCFNIVKCF